MTHRFDSAGAPPVNDNLTEKYNAERAHLADVRRRHDAMIKATDFIADNLAKSGVDPVFAQALRRPT